GPYRIGGHADHVHAGVVQGQRWQDVQDFLNMQGIAAIPTSTTGGSHAAGSLHYLGRAVDYGDSVNNVWAVFNALKGYFKGEGGGNPITDLLSGLLNMLPSLPDFHVTQDIPGIMKGAAEGVVTGAYNWVKNAATDLISSLMSHVGGNISALGGNAREK